MATTSDRPTIKALAHELPDSEWQIRFDHWAEDRFDFGFGEQTERALLAELDEVLEGLSKTMQERLRWLDEGRVGWVIFSKRDLLHRAGLFDNRAAQTVTPFGRAVLKRRQDKIAQAVRETGSRGQVPRS